MHLERRAPRTNSAHMCPECVGRFFCSYWLIAAGMEAILIFLLGFFLFCAAQEWRKRRARARAEKRWK